MKYGTEKRELQQEVVDQGFGALALRPQEEESASGERDGREDHYVIAQRRRDGQKDDGEDRELGIEAFKEAGETGDHPEEQESRGEGERREEESWVDERGDDLLASGFAELEIAHIGL